MILILFNFIGNINRYRLWKRKWHCYWCFTWLFVLFLLGINHCYISYEGQMHIREGETSNEIITDKNFFKIQIERGGDRLSYARNSYMDGFSRTTHCEKLFHRFKAKV